ncbi:MAG: DEAD/DEAH box helicase family protein [Verrucomicrobia bacterium]|nr:DEAD/DEAH box helicase family protein [Verrucomicrobiota bacterium]
MDNPKHPKALRFHQLFDGISNFPDLERRIENLPTDRRGDAFEVFAEAFFATQPEQRAKHVWPCKVTPPSIKRRLGLTRRDMGVDGVVEVKLGGFFAYQAKFRSNRPSLNWTELSTFLGLTDRVGERVLFTNSTKLPDEVINERRGFHCIGGNTLDRLEARDFAAIRGWLAGAAPVRERRSPDKPNDFAQQKALDEIIPALRKHDRATVVRACGTGKTLLALWAAERVAKRNVLVLVPSLALMRQTLKEWANETRWPKFDYLCVCSDPTVSQGSDELVIRPTELEFSVSTQPAEVRRFLSHPFDGIKIVFSTYQSAEVVARGMRRGQRFDLGIFDEAHKTAGREGQHFSFALSDRNLPICKRLFLTATPRHYDLRHRDQEGEPIKLYSMDDEKVYGPVVHKLPFSKAAKHGIICNYKVVISVVTSKTLDNELLRRGTVLVKGDEIRAQQVANQIALAQAVRKHGVEKIFTFHSKVASAKSFASDGTEGIGSHLKDFQAFHVNGEMRTAERDAWMDEFRAAPKAVMTNARCLTEGIDVPAVDMVAFLSPKRSRVDIVQAAGRAMRRAPGKTAGYLLVPLFVNQAKGETIEQAVERAEFDEVWAVLQAMQEHDEVLDVVTHEILASRRLVKGFDDSRFRERVEILGPAISLPTLRKAITTKCIERLGRPWDTMVQLLLLFKKKFGHTRVQRGACGRWAELGQWVDQVRALYRNDHLSPDRQAQLNAMGFEWRVDSQTLDDTAGLLNEDQFKKASGFTNVAEYRRKGLINPVGFAMAGAGLSAFYRLHQVNELKGNLGITLDDTHGLLTEQQFRNVSKLTKIAAYREKGLIKPVGIGMSAGGVSTFYHPKQVRELKKKLGITLDDTKKLLSEEQFKEASGLSRVAKYRRDGLIRPAGFGMAGSGVGPFYHPKQIKELKRKLGITIEDTTGLLNESQIAKTSGLAAIAKYRRQGLIKPAGIGLSASKLSRFYHPKQIKKLKKKLGITLNDTRGLLTENQFKKASGLTQVADYRRRGLIKPVGVGMSATSVTPFYHAKQIKELKKELGITLDDTKGLLNEEQFRKASGLSKVGDYRRRGLIKPVGFAIAGPGIGTFYLPKQISELKQKLGITLDDTKGLLSENQFKNAFGLTAVDKYRRSGFIKPAGVGMSATRVTFFYRPKQIKKLKKKLGITLDNTSGLLNEEQFRKASGITVVANYRRRGLIKPVGFAMAASRLSAYYHPKQIKQLRRKLGITLEDTKGLLTEKQFKKASGLTAVDNYRRRGLIKPVGFGVTNSGVGPFYVPKQIKELKKELGITLNDTRGLLNEAQFKKAAGLTQVGNYRRRGLIKPLGFAMAGPGLSAFYHPKQIAELKRKLGIKS